MLEPIEPFLDPDVKRTVHGGLDKKATKVAFTELKRRGAHYLIASLLEQYEQLPDVNIVIDELFKGEADSNGKAISLLKVNYNKILAKLLPKSSIYSHDNHPIKYNDCLFRSILEAKYAYLFKSLGISWEYEPKIFKTSKGYYLPDFYLPQWDTFIELKASFADSIELHKMKSVADQSGSLGLLVGGYPDSESSYYCPWTKEQRARANHMLIYVFKPKMPWQKITLLELLNHTNLKFDFWVASMMKSLSGKFCKDSDSEIFAKAGLRSKEFFNFYRLLTDNKFDGNESFKQYLWAGQSFENIIKNISI